MNEYLCTGGRVSGAADTCGCGRPQPSCPAPNPPAVDGTISGCACPPPQSCPGQCPPPCPNQRPEAAAAESCACRKSMVQGLQMLLRSGLNTLVDFNQFAFVTPDYIVGAGLSTPAAATTPYDNLTPPLAGVFSRFTYCACDYIDASGDVYLPVAGTAATGLTVSRLNLCDLLAVAFTTTGTTAAEVTENYQSARRLLQNLLQPPCRTGMYPPYPDPCDCACCQCCPEDLTGGTLSLLAGSLLLANTALLGQLGNLLVLANDTDQRLYFVCSEGATLIR